ncbi:MAG: type VI secretion system baseplate subunit TssE [Gemmatimonadaceae bacterium]|jgi:type VI secretion system protein ImpF|nr:type VI secretion system baseplate subunit TssE [Gemmatimonadaceae bacterium]
MARQELEQLVPPSLLDRLIDEEPRLAGEGTITQAASADAFVAGVRRDLEWLLNTRRPPIAVPAHLTELEHSAFTFGIPDTTSLGREALGSRRRLQQWLEEAIATFEPRLRDVRVSLGELPNDGSRQLRFIVRGELQMEPRPVDIAFDATLDAAGTYDVRDGSDA